MVVSDRTYFVDWTNHLWLVGKQQESIRELGHPSLFLHTHETGLFYPFYAFYGGTLYAFTGLLGLALGSSLAAYLVMYGVGIGMAYGGTLWTARQAGVRGVGAHAPSLLVVTSSYYLTNAYGRGAWPEFIAFSALPLLVAGGIHIVTAARPRAAAVGAVLFAAALFSGSHTITLLWGTIFVVLLGLITSFALRWEELRRRVDRLALVFAAITLGVGVNLWFLLPNLMYGHDTLVYELPLDESIPTANEAFTSFRLVFSPWRSVPDGSGTPELFVQAPVLPLLWVLAAMATLIGSHRGKSLRRLAYGLLFLLGLYAILVSGNWIWTSVPDVIRLVQFPYRLNSYLILTIASLAIVGLIAVGRSPRRGLWYGTLALGLAAQMALAQWHVWTAKTYEPLAIAEPRAAHTPRTFYAKRDFRTTVGPEVDAPRRMDPRPEMVDSDRLTLNLGAGRQPYVTNIVNSPLVRATSGARAVGHDASWLVIEPTDSGGVPGATAVIEPGRPTSVIAGRVASILSLALAAALMIGVGLHGRRRRVPRLDPAASPTTTP